MDGSEVSDVDLSAEVERIRNHRFDGYADGTLADEIDSFRAGVGTAGLGEAVDALRAVAAELARTDATLREELGKLGVEWQSDAGQQAGARIDEKARFSDEANQKVNRSAEMIFAQGEAFNRTLHKLPDSHTLRAGSGGLTLGDSLASLIGFETDHSKAVGQAREARQQAVDALNGYAVDSGENLAGIESISQPDSVQNASYGGAPGSGVDPVMGAAFTESQAPGDTRPSAGAPLAPGSPPPVPLPTTSSGAGYHPPAPQYVAPVAPGRATGSEHSAPGRTAPSGTSPSSLPAHAPSPAPVAGVVGSVRPAPGHSSGHGPTPGVPVAPNAPQPGAVPPSHGGPAPVGGVVGGGSGNGGAPAGRPGGVPGGFGTPGGGPPVPGGTQGLPGKAGFSAAPEQPGGRSPSAPGVPVTPGSPGGSGGGGGNAPVQGSPVQGSGPSEGPLGKGSMTGSGTPSPGGSAPQPPPAVTPKMAAGGTGLGMGAAAMAAGAAGGATAGFGGGDQERANRSQRGGTRPLPMGALPDEQASTRNAESVRAKQGKPQSAFLERAAQQNAPDEEDAEHVRRYGIDDADLFNDRRMVSPEVLGHDDDSERA
ncbi:hypothetical protein CFN78_20035 [Amycolatopsis antarctica]|uniref:PPE family domain-containing protein n=1 Tax=Amycolatopsis antarctica TaxID=1854586 RepID=A0A263CZA6_9PSEU|nr:hypothetical protein [Amycolatopsis antarctica]OZM71441.1 hypothetical protein CFN78_20035 [Amycolatopsis antarctica]